MRVGELAAAIGVTTATVRFYEANGILDRSLVTRSTNNYRDYHPDAVEQLRLAVSAKQLGFSVAEIANLADIWRNGGLDDRQRLQAIEEKLDRLRARRRDLDEMIEVLEAKLRDHTS